MKQIFTLQIYPLHYAICSKIHRPAQLLSAIESPRLGR